MNRRTMLLHVAATPLALAVAPRVQAETPAVRPRRSKPFIDEPLDEIEFKAKVYTKLFKQGGVTICDIRRLEDTAG